MKAGDLKRIICGLHDDVEVCISVGRGQDMDSVVSQWRDVLERDGTLEATILQIKSKYSGGQIGLPHLDEKERERQRREVLDGLADMRRPYKGANRNFTDVHGDYRIFSNFNGINDSCYGTVYDPRVFAELESDGLIVKATVFGRSTYFITDKGFNIAERKPAA